jgi:ElaB/YqjD/DUF883 family membrane-anchored ribosome-binding protein
MLPAGSDPGRRGMKDRLTGAASHVRDTAADFGRSAADNIDRNLHGAAGTLENAASSLRSRTGMGSGRMNDLARTAADKIDTTARYLRDYDTRTMVSGAEQAIRRNPGISLAVAVGIGVLIGASMGKDRRHRY